MDWRSGHLVAWYEQEWEGRIECCFVPDGSRELPLPVRDGDRLRVLDEAGTTLFDGTVSLVRRRFWEGHRLGNAVWSETRQRGVAYGDWVAWFWERRRATLAPSDA